MSERTPDGMEDKMSGKMFERMPDRKSETNVRENAR